MQKNLFFYLMLMVFSACSMQPEPDTMVADAEPIVFRAGLEKRIVQDNDFAIDLFQRAVNASTEQNILVSPLSVSIALGMTWNGAIAETKSGMEAALKMSGLTKDEINDYYKVLQSTLPNIDPTTELGIANSVWYKTGYPVRSEFKNTAIDYFKSEVRELDFSQPWAVDSINGWCARKTNQHITDILDQIPGDAVMYLVNAMYFKGIWRKPFDKKNTKVMTFTDEKKQASDVNMMFQKDTFNYTYDDKAQYIDLTYGNKAFSMTVILPHYNSSVSGVLAELTSESLGAKLKNMKSQEISLYFPRFRSKSKFLLNSVLSDMGMSRAFQDWDEFREMADADIYISRVLHDTSIEVTEEGTVAAAATVVEMTEKSAATNYFNVNRPFIYVIRENSTGVILFIGKMGKVELF